MAFRADNIHSFNRYAYANNNPYTYVDPDGQLGTLVHALQRGVSLEQAARVGQAGTAALGGYAATGYLENVASGEYARQTLARYGELLDGVMRRDPNALEALFYEVGIPGSVVAKGVAPAFKDFNQARNAALQWLEARGFKAEQATLGKFGNNAGKPIGMKTADGRVGFRVEYDARNGAHINVWAGKEKGPHFPFEGDQSTVDRIVKQFVK